MIVDQLPTFGLLMALTSAGGNALGEVLRKRLVGRFSPGTVTFAYRLPTALFIGIIILLMSRQGATVHIVDRGPLFGAPFLHFAPVSGFAIYMVIVIAILGTATWMHLKAFQVGELSTTAPLLSFTPVFALFTTWIAFQQYPSPVKFIGIMLVVAGAFAIHLDVLSKGPFDPIKAIFKDPGSRWMMGVCGLYAIVSPIEKSVVDMSGPYLESMVLAFGTAAMWLTAGIARGEQEQLKSIFRKEPWRLFFLSSSDAIVLVTYYIAMSMMPPFIMQTMRRADLLIVVLMGALIFKEKNIARKFFGCSIMVVGVCIIVIKNLSLDRALEIAALGLVILLPLSVLAVVRERRRDERLLRQSTAAAGFES